MKFCVDCKYYEKYDYCLHPNNGYNLVTGLVDKAFCSFSRTDNSILSKNSCGTEGKLFEQKQDVKLNNMWSKMRFWK